MRTDSGRVELEMQALPRVKGWELSMRAFWVRVRLWAWRWRLAFDMHRYRNFVCDSGWQWRSVEEYRDMGLCRWRELREVYGEPWSEYLELEFHGFRWSMFMPYWCALAAEYRNSRDPELMRRRAWLT